MDKDQPLVTVIIVNYQGEPWLSTCLAALRTQTYRHFITLVVDNGSNDESCTLIRRDFPEAILIEMGCNPGFAAAVNRALQAAQTEFIALLNPDTRPEDEWLAELVQAANEHPEIVAFGSQLLMAEDPERLDGIGDAYHVSGRVWRIGHGRRKTAADDKPMEIFSPSAAAALYRTAAIRTVGGMDERLFCYLEDIDLGFRLRLLGHRCLYVPRARVLHVGSAIAGRHSDFQTYHGHRNLVWVFVKNMPGFLFWLLLPVHILMNLFSILALALDGRGKAIWQAKRDALQGLGVIWKERQSVQKTRRIGLGCLCNILTWRPFKQ